MSIIQTILQQIPLPSMVPVEQRFPLVRVPDITMAVKEAIARISAFQNINADSHERSVAVAVGSRGIAGIATIVKCVVAELKSLGFAPFIVPAMGSHGGATDEGQKAVLAALGITEERVHAPIRSSMEVMQIGVTPSGIPVYCDRLALEADAILLVNRVKPHTVLPGPVESGLIKMAAIGLGKQRGAQAIHSRGFANGSNDILEVAREVFAKAPIVGGIAIVENAYGEPAKIVGINRDRIEEEELPLLREAYRLLATLLIDPIDALVVYEMGKNISGDGMDPNVIGRFPEPHRSGGAHIQRIGVLNLTPETHGNANGIGLADFITERVRDQIDFEKTYANSLTSNLVNLSKVPITLKNDREVIQAALKTCINSDKSGPSLVLIRNTLELQRIYVSENLTEAVHSHPSLQIVGDSFQLPFDAQGNLDGLF
ncbi:lactate racemase domain-containing protein [Alicyclobacillus macrosporangiidus]|uniref:lactate racemase domain-containing protein n=1 Tax=Alicyclobacillus macrosporangiidus TaxID=392015 RepID=UPI0004952127|nr:lactate racemase domain-containing protein [Alicyclobacillus macrosporangiidus]